MSGMTISDADRAKIIEAIKIRFAGGPYDELEWTQKEWLSEKAHEALDAALSAGLAMSDPENPHAFPLVDDAPQRGATLRDVFAWQALAQCMSYSLSYANSWEPDEVARLSYQLADAMLRERAKEPKP